jgi:protein-tyrosine phosphatase
MDDKNLAELKCLVPKQYQGYLGLLLPFGSQTQYASVPDPYHGNEVDFELVLDLVEDAAAGLLRSIQQHHFSSLPQPSDN